MALQARKVIATKTKYIKGSISLSSFGFILFGFFFLLIYHQKYCIFLKAALLYILGTYAFLKDPVFILPQKPERSQHWFC
jgi:hypothetical protein